MNKYLMTLMLLVGARMVFISRTSVKAIPYSVTTRWPVSRAVPVTLTSAASMTARAI